MEEIGAVVTAGLIAHEIEAGSAANQHTAHHCANCATPLQGKFCHSCGQSGHIHHSLLHLVEEVLHGVWHFDAKGWRTLPALVARPGELTRSYIDGQRMRYLSPLALFLFMFLFFVFCFLFFVFCFLFFVFCFLFFVFCFLFFLSQVRIPVSSFPKQWR